MAKASDKKSRSGSCRCPAAGNVAHRLPPPPVRQLLEQQQRLEARDGSPPHVLRLDLLRRGEHPVGAIECWRDVGDGGDDVECEMAVPSEMAALTWPRHARVDLRPRTSERAQRPHSRDEAKPSESAFSDCCHPKAGAADCVALGRHIRSSADCPEPSTRGAPVKGAVSAAFITWEPSVGERHVKIHHRWEECKVCFSKTRLVPTVRCRSLAI